MKITILSQFNHYGLVGALAAQLSRLSGIDLLVVTYEPTPIYGDPNPPLTAMGPKDLAAIVKRVETSDIVHIFNECFVLHERDSGGNKLRDFNIEKLVKPDRLLFTYMPEYFNVNWPAIFFKHYRQGILATGWPVAPYQQFCPLPLIHMPPVLDLDGIPEKRKNPAGGNPVIAVSTQNRDRHQIEPIVKTLLTQREHVAFSIQWLENLSRPDYLSELGRADIFIDSFRFTGLTPMALEAMAAGAVVVTNLTGLDLTLYPGAPVVPTKLDTLGDTIARLVRDKTRLEESGRQSAAWVREQLKPEDTVARWVNLYRHMQCNGGELDGNAHI